MYTNYNEIELKNKLVLWLTTVFLMFTPTLSAPRFSQMIEYLASLGELPPSKPKAADHYAELDEALLGFIRKRNKTFQQLVTLMQDACQPYLDGRDAHEKLVDRRLQVLRLRSLIKVTRKGNAFLWNVN
ncbi:hypothetical protein [Comamonas thiooxydans]|uniref:hypothetical protein n=1 Tax=Comamonas thiooxydans TaxID=363952 RepID=UPI000B40A824|nr:hypothetical protein [Comamonas thiooxydans]